MVWLFRGLPLRLLEKYKFPPYPFSLCSQLAKSLPQQFVASRDAALQVLSILCQPMMTSAPEMHALAPTCPLLLKVVLAPAESAPDPDVSPLCHRCVLQAGVLTAPLPVHLPVFRNSYSRSCHPPTTPVQCKAAVTSMMNFLDVSRNWQRMHWQRVLRLQNNL